MKLLHIKVPDVGVEAAMEVIEICVSVGDHVEEDTSIAVLESDKTTVEVPCPGAGKVQSIELKLGDKVHQGDMILVLEASSEKIVADVDTAEKVEEEEVTEVPKDVLAVTTVAQTLKEIRVPDLGGSEQVEVIEITVSAGQRVDQDDTLLVLESDKATMDIPSPFAGVLETLVVSVGDKVSEGDKIAVILSDELLESGSSLIKEHVSSVASANQIETLPTEIKQEEAESPVQQADFKNEPHDSPNRSVHAGPAVRKLARELGADIFRVSGSGPKGRVLKEDLNAYIKLQVTRAQDGEGRGGQSALPRVKMPDFSVYGEVDQKAMDKIQRLTAENMQTSWLTVPHVTQFDEADISEMEIFRKQQKQVGDEKGIKLTPMAFLIKACAYALRQLPQFNVSVDMHGHQVYQKKYVHIGIAVDTPNGLVVPVIRDADKKSLWELAKDCQTLALKGRERKLVPADMQGGCFTISSLGGLGGTAFTPIVNTPEVAILGVSKAQYKPVYDSQNESFVPRLMLPLSLSYDHRAVNGADAARFTSLLSNVLGDLRGLLL